MQIIPTRLHGVFDYVTGLTLIAAPLALPNATPPAADRALVAFGLLSLGYSAFTRYEAGLLKVLPMTAHRAFDYAHAAAFALAPWVLGFPEHWLACAAVAAAELFVTTHTRPEPPYVAVAAEPDTEDAEEAAVAR